MIRLGINRHIIILICTGYLCIGIASITVLAQVPGHITGYVLDEEGRPVPNANVSLWQNGQLWKLPIYQSYPIDNPQTTRIAYTDERWLGVLREGGFIFGFTYPGDYTLTAEKDGYRSNSTSVHVNGSTTRDAAIAPEAVTVNITLNGYHLPVLSPEQLSYTGAIAGEIRTLYGSRGNANVSLWQNGQMVNRPDNPQWSSEHNFSGKRVDYLFDHLAPGRYTVRAKDYISNETIIVDVGTRPMRADIVLTRSLQQPTGRPDVSFSPTVGEFSAFDRADPKPTPVLPWIVGLLAIGSVAYLLNNKNNKP